MECASCKVNNINPRKAPYVAFLCDNNHLQCKSCEEKHLGLCGVCKLSTHLLEMHFPEEQCLLNAAISKEQMIPNRRTNHHLNSTILNTGMYKIHEEDTNKSDESAKITTKAQVSSALIMPIADAISKTTTNGDSVSDNTLAIYVCETIEDEGTESSSSSSNRLECNARSSSLANNISGRSDSSLTERAHVSKLRYKLTTTVCRTVQIDDVDSSSFAAEEYTEEYNRNEDSDQSFVSEEECESMNVNFKETSTENMKTATNVNTKSFNDNGRQYQNLEKLNSDDEDIDWSGLDSLNTMTTNDIVQRYLSSYDTTSYPESTPSDFPIGDFQRQSCDAIAVSSHTTTGQSHDQSGNNTNVDQNVTIAHAKCLMPQVKTFTYPTKTENMKSSDSEGSEACMNKLFKSFREKVTLSPNFKKPKTTASQCSANELLHSLQEQPQMTGTVRMMTDSLFIQIRGYHVYKLPMGVPRKELFKTEENDKCSLVNAPSIKALSISSSCSAAITDIGLDFEIFSTYLLNGCRAFFSPLSESDPLYKELYCSNDYNKSESSLLVQFEPLNCTQESLELIQTKACDAISCPIKAELLNIIRTPLRCPHPSCGHLVFVSDFSKHLAIEHPNIPAETISSQQWKHVHLDIRLPHRGKTHCHMVLFLKHKILGLGSSKFKDYLPIVLLSSRTTSTDIANLHTSRGIIIQSGCEQDYLMVWMATLPTDTLHITATMAVYKFVDNKPVIHVVRSGKVYSIRESQHMPDVWESAPYILLSAKQLSLLSNNRLHRIEMQLFIH